MIQGCQFCYVPFKMTGISRSNLKNETNKLEQILSCLES